MDSSQSIKVIVNGKPYLVEVEDLHASPVNVAVNGRTYQVVVGSAADKDGRDQEPTVMGSSQSTAAVETAAADDAAPAAPAAGTIIAPMPGNIVSVAVSAGDHVGQDQVLCMLEAMKMQNAIRSPRTAVISTVNIAVGQAVGYGEILFTFE